MWVIKKLNNNVAVCIDDNGDQLVAFGNGIGFPSVPYELVDMSRVTMTFYQLDRQYYQLLKDVPSDIFDISAQIVKKAQKLLTFRKMSPNLFFSLADHMNFSLTRLEEYQGLLLPFSYDIKELYPVETTISIEAVEMINQRFNVQLPPSEITAITMHLVNSQFEKINLPRSTKDDVQLIEEATKIVEQELEIVLNREDFTYNRFVMHLRYYLKRLQLNSQIDENKNNSLFNVMKSEEPEIYLSAKQISDYLDNELNTTSSQEEIFYLMIYIKRISSK